MLIIKRNYYNDYPNGILDQMNFTITGKIQRTLLSVDRKINLIVFSIYY